MKLSLSNFVHDLGQIGRTIWTTIKVDLHYIQDPDHRASIEHYIDDVAIYGAKAIPIAENIADTLLPAEKPIIDAVAAAALKMDLKIKDFAEKPSYGTFLALGGESLREAIRKDLPKLANGVTIAGQVIEDEQALDAVAPAVLQSIFGAHVGAYVASAGQVDIAIQGVLTDLAAAAAEPATPATSQPAPGIDLSKG